MAPKDKDNKRQRNGVIYQFKCPHSNCLEEYIRESGRSFGDRLKEHLRASSHIHQHRLTTGHPVSLEYFTIVYRESQGITRTIKEAMFICVNDPFLNRNLGKYQLPHFRTLNQCGLSNKALQPPQWAHTPIPIPPNMQRAHTFLM